MEYKKAINVLMSLLNKRSFDKEEKEAILTAVGVLDWVSLYKGRVKKLIKARKAKRDRDIER